MTKDSLIQEIVENMARCQRPTNFGAWQRIGLSHAQVGMLFMLSYHRTLQAKKVAEFLGVSKSAISQLIDPLVEKGLISRQSDENDRRVAILSLTPSGTRMLKRLARHKYAGFRSRLETLSTDELSQMAVMVRKMCQNPGK